MFSKRIISMLVVLSFISQALVVVDTDSYSSAVVEDSSILEELSEQNGARSGTVENYTLYKDVEMNPITFDYDGVDADWEIYPDLPASLSFNSENGTITGTPDELFDFTNYTIYANASSIPTTPPDSILYYNVGDDDDGDEYWEDLRGNEDYDIIISNLDRVEVTGITDFTHAYRFDSSSDTAVMGDNFQDWSGDLTDDSISIEIWFKPSALSGNKVLWEIGGSSDGNSLVLMGNELTYRLKTSGDNNAYVDISTTISLDSEFHNAVVVLDEDAEMAYLYYDGELEASASFSGDFDWGGNNKAGIGGENDNVGGYTNSEQTEHFGGDTTFRGDIAVHRILEDALDSSEVAALFDQFTSYRFKETYEIRIQSLPSPYPPAYSVNENEAIEPITFDYLEAYREEAAYKGSGNISVITQSTFTSSEDHVVVNDIIFFHAITNEYGNALWKTDGTADGVELVKDINPGSNAEIYHGLTRFKDSILFSANDGTHGEELWISDGTENGTFMLKDMDEGGEDSDSDPHSFLDAGDFAYFSGSDDSEDRELWKTDGTTDGTVRVKDIVSDGSSYPSQLTLFGDEVFFVVGDQDLSSQLWKTDGTDEGTIRVSGVSRISELTVMGDALYFKASGSGCGGKELWKTDGTSDGTVCVKDINPGSDSSTPQTLTAAGGTLFFNADDGTHGGELWKSDGTEDGTVLVKDIRSGGAHSQILDMASFGNIVYFGAHDGSNGNELWRSDGTEDGTYLVKDIAPGWQI